MLQNHDFERDSGSLTSCSRNAHGTLQAQFGLRRADIRPTVHKGELTRHREVNRLRSPSPSPPPTPPPWGARPTADGGLAQAVEMILARDCAKWRLAGAADV